MMRESLRRPPLGSIAILPWLVASLVAGCASTPPAAPNADAFRVISTTTPADALAAERIVDLSPGETRFSLVDENSGSPSESIIVRREATHEYGADFAIHEGDRRSEFLKCNADGSIAMTAAIDRAENALTLFDPPLIVVPASLEANQPFTSEAAIRVVALDNPAKQRERGTAKRVVTYIADALIQTRNGEFRAAKIEIQFTADLRFADADERTTLYIVRGESAGVIVQKSIEKVTILAAFPRTTRRTMLREE